MTSPKVSILLPTWNGARTLPAVLDAIDAQQASFVFETVAVDSGSTDATVEILERRIGRVLRIPNHSFNHGLTRNFGIEHCRGELVVLLVQDAVPASKTWLDRLTAPLFADERLGGTYGRQVARPDASAVTRHYLERWVASSPVARTSFLAGSDEFQTLPPGERYLRCIFDDVCSCVRRSIWKQHPFPETTIAEDLEWAREVLLAGYGLAYTPEATVVHSHERSALYEFRRTYLVHERLHALFGLRTIPTAIHLIRAIALTLGVHFRCLRTGPTGPQSWPAEAVRALALAVAWPAGQYLGGRVAEKGWPRLRPRGI